MRNIVINTIETNSTFKKGTCKKVFQNSRIHGILVFKNTIVNFEIPEKRNGIKLIKSSMYFADYKALSNRLSKLFTLDGCAMIFDFGVIIPAFGGFLIQDNKSKNVIKIGNITALVEFVENATIQSVNSMFEVKIEANGIKLEEIKINEILSAYSYEGKNNQGLFCYQYANYNEFYYLDYDRNLIYNNNMNLIGFFNGNN